MKVEIQNQTIEEIIDAIKTVEQLKRVYTVLKSEVSRQEGVSELCKEPCITTYEARLLNLDKASDLSAILALYKSYIENQRK